MNKKDNSKIIPKFSFMEPAIYQIKVYGKIHDKFSGYFSGMKLLNEKIDSSETISILQGELRDQTALSGILNTLYDMRLSIMSVEQIEKKNVEPQ